MSDEHHPKGDKGGEDGESGGDVKRPKEEEGFWVESLKMRPGPIIPWDSEPKIFQIVSEPETAGPGGPRSGQAVRISGRAYQRIVQVKVRMEETHLRPVSMAEALDAWIAAVDSENVDFLGG